MDLLTKNVRVAAGAGAGICALIALGVYQPADNVSAALTTFVALGAGAAGAALVAFLVGKFGAKKDEAPK